MRHVAPAVSGFFRSVALGQVNLWLRQLMLVVAPFFLYHPCRRMHWYALVRLAASRLLPCLQQAPSLSTSLPCPLSLPQAAGDRTGNLQDILRLLTLWFNHGHYEDVGAALQEGFALVSIDTWLVVIPQV